MSILLCRKIKNDIAVICDYIYKKRLGIVRELWDQLERELKKIVLEDEKFSKVLKEAEMCVCKGNYLRLHDLLTYEIDFFLTHKLLTVSEEERKIFSEKAKKENEKELMLYHKELDMLSHKTYGLSNVECLYEGVENISIMIKENDNKFRLFSQINPWMESIGIINSKKSEVDFPDEIWVLGFGGGHMIKELGRRYPKTQIKVYIPNMNIFQTILFNMPLNEILTNKRIKLFYDPLCLDFIEMLKANVALKAKKSIIIYFNRQEIRACYKSTMMEEIFISKYKDILVGNNTKNLIYEIKQYGIGKYIYKYING